ncbi:MAG TPA: DUF2493 domain-containing protein [Thermodesulfobacteriaceae bacterium]|nr:DUF2493 domain-containing protein [Thermodesulfobacteriaceae bacterium]
MAKIAVAGSRSIESYEFVKGVLENLLVQGDIVLSGNAPGADRLGERYAAETGLEVKIVPSKWEQHGLKATMMRNEVLLKAADCVISLWDGKSEGGRHMLEISKRDKKLLAEVRPDGFMRLYLNPRLLR